MKRITSRYKRPAVVLVQVAVVLTVLLGFVALTVDVGRMCNTRADLVNAADAGALAGALFYTTGTSQAIRSGTYLGDASAITDARVSSLAGSIVYENYALGGVKLRVLPEQIRAGWFDLDNPAAPLRTDVPVSQFNAAQVTVQRSSNSPNGALDLLFARVFGKETTDVGATAIAGFDDRVAGYNPKGPTTPLTPFVIQEDAFKRLVSDGPDEYSYDDDSDAVESLGDDVSEIHLYPLDIDSGVDNAGAGNFGTLNVGVLSQGTDDLGDQVMNGISLDDIEAEVGTRELSFVTDSGEPTTYEISGNPGLSVGLEPSIEARIGDVIGFFLYSNVVDTGSNTTYTITGLRFGRLLQVDLTTAKKARRIIVQPVVYAGSDVDVNPLAPRSGGLIGRLMLLR